MDEQQHYDRLLAGIGTEMKYDRRDREWYECPCFDNLPSNGGKLKTINARDLIGLFDAMELRNG